MSKFNKQITLNLLLLGFLVVTTFLGVSSFNKKIEYQKSLASGGIDPSSKILCTPGNNIPECRNTNCTNCVKQQSGTIFRSWKDWYPVNQNLPNPYKGADGKWIAFRNINWWGDSYFNGLSSMNVPEPLATLPTNKDYYFFWQCYKHKGVTPDPFCYNQNFYREIISQSTDDVLETWARGGDTNANINNVIWEVYYNPDIIGYANCNGEKLYNTTLDLTLSSSKKPWVLKLPINENTFYLSSPICTIAFKGYTQNKTRVIDTRSNSQGFNPDKLSFETGNWISFTIVHSQTNDQWGFPIVRAENIYLTDNSNASGRFNTKYCSGRTDSFRCPSNKPLEYSLNGRIYRAFAFEEYYMRKTQKSGRYSNFPNVIDKYGFGSFRWFTNPASSYNWDQVDNNYKRNDSESYKNQVWDLQRCTLDNSYWTSSCTNL